jgi:hypothetical protein
MCCTCRSSCDIVMAPATSVSFTKRTGH